MRRRGNALAAVPICWRDDSPSGHLYAQHVSDWTVRPAVRGDEPCIVQMWMHALLRFSFGRSQQKRPAPGSAEHIAFWRAAQPVVEGLLRSPRVEVVVTCDPTRATYAEGQPAVVCGWAMYDAERVYGVGIKRDYLPSPEASQTDNAVVRDIGLDLARATLGEVIGSARRTVMPLYDLHRLGLQTPLWTIDDAWLDLMADVARLDAVSADVSRHVLDPQRVPWEPSDKRDA